MGAKGLISKALKAAPKQRLERAALEATVTAALVAKGKSAKKAQKIIAKKIKSLPCFIEKGSTVIYSKEPVADESPHATKRGAESDTDAKPTKKQKKEKAAPAPAPAPAPAAGSKIAALGECKMMEPSVAAAFRKENRIEVSGDGCESFRPVAAFRDAGFSKVALEACSGFAKPTPIQSECWPVMMAGRDIVGVAETGSGKTLAFFLPAMMHMASMPTPPKGAGPSVLILAPTRELAMQSDDVCRKAADRASIRSICIYGGVPKHPQKQAIRDGARVVVATPGRLLDLEQEGAVSLDHVTYLVLDEADRMLDMGFEKDVRAIIAKTDPARRTVMFTATWPESIRELAAEFLTSPVRVNVGSQELAANVRVSQTVEVLDESRKSSRLPQLLEQYHKSKGSTNRVLVFALYKKEAARLESDIRRHGYNAIGIHGDMTQAARTAALQQFKDGTVPLLIATDVAARGLDIPDVEVVINYTFPLTIEDYIHRIGRTGRGGKTGISHTLFTGSPQFEKPLAGALQNVLREAGQPVPDALLKFGSSVKKKEHKMYGAFAGGGGEMKQATKITF